MTIMKAPSWTARGLAGMKKARCAPVSDGLDDQARRESPVAEEPQRDIQLQGADHPVGVARASSEENAGGDGVEMNQPVFHVVDVMEKTSRKRPSRVALSRFRRERRFVTLDQEKQDDTRRKCEKTGRPQGYRRRQALRVAIMSESGERIRSGRRFVVLAMMREAVPSRSPC
jgi:hypothetical protein